jgi:hypothetical protein
LPDVARHSSVSKANKGGRSETFTKADGPADHILHLRVRFARWRLRPDSMAIRAALPGQTAPKFGDHHPNTQAPPNEQARIEVPKQPLVARGIGPLLNKQRESPKMSNAKQNHSNQNFEHQQHSNEQIDTGTASSNAFLAIATAYGDYTKKSFEDTKLFVEKLSDVKSLDKAIEVQTEFAKTVYDTFVTESQKIGVLYSDLAKQSYKPFGDLAAKMTPTNR